MLRITTKHSSPAVNNMMQRSLSVVLPSMSSISQHGSARNMMTSTTLPTMHYSKQLQQQHRQLSSQPPGGGGMNLGNIFNNAKQQGNKKPGETLEQFGVDLTKLAQDGKLDPVIGRHEEIRRTLQILGKFYLYIHMLLQRVIFAV